MNYVFAAEKVEEEATSLWIFKYIHVIVCFIGLQSPVVTVARDPMLQMIFNKSRVRSNNLIWPSFSRNVRKPNCHLPKMPGIGPNVMWRAGVVCICLKCFSHNQPVLPMQQMGSLHARLLSSYCQHWVIPLPTPEGKMRRIVWYSIVIISKLLQCLVTEFSRTWGSSQPIVHSRVLICLFNDRGSR